MFFSISTACCAASYTKGIARLSPAEIARITIPNETKDILVGILLGDAHIVRRSSTGNSRLVYAQTWMSRIA